MKITGIIVFIFLLIFQSTGYYLFLKIQQKHIRYEIKQQIKAGVPVEELVLLKISRSTQENRREFQYIHSREFRYFGKMYDIIRQESHGETTWFYCINDEKETLLFARLDEQVKNEMKNLPGSGKEREQLLQWHNTLFFAEDNITGIINPSFNDRSTPYSFHLKDWKQPPETPPPLI